MVAIIYNMFPAWYDLLQTDTNPKLFITFSNNTKIFFLFNVGNCISIVITGKKLSFLLEFISEGFCVSFINREKKSLGWINRIKERHRPDSENNVWASEVDFWLKLQLPP